jgi:hypothetical protein
MMIKSLCNTCLQPYDINLQPGDIHLIKQIADDSGLMCSCPRLCGGSINLSALPDGVIDESKLKDTMSITGSELYKAVQGAGLPDEIPKNPLIVEALLKANCITGVLMEEKSNRLYIHQLVLGNGVVIHMTSGSHGAMVLKLTKGVDNASQDHS